MLYSHAPQKIFHPCRFGARRRWFLNFPLSRSSSVKTTLMVIGCTHIKFSSMLLFYKLFTWAFPCFPVGLLTDSLEGVLKTFSYWHCYFGFCHRHCYCFCYCYWYYYHLALLDPVLLLFSRFLNHLKVFQLVNDDHGDGMAVMVMIQWWWSVTYHDAGGYGGDSCQYGDDHNCHWS